MVALGGAAVSYERGTPVQPFVYGMGWPCPAKMQPLASRGPPTEPTTPIDCSNPRFFMSDSWGGGPNPQRLLTSTIFHFRFLGGNGHKIVGIHRFPPRILQLKTDPVARAARVGGISHSTPGFRVQDAGFRVQGSGSRVTGLDTASRSGLRLCHHVHR